MLRPLATAARLSLLAIAFGLSSCSWQSLFPGNELAVTSTEYNFTIEPETVLLEIARGGSRVFVPAGGTPEGEIEARLQAVHWTQNDYMQVADALHQVVWHESPQGWSLSRFALGMACVEASDGPQFASVKYFVIRGTGQDPSRFVSSLYIDPRKGFVSVLKSQYNPIRQEWQSVRLADLSVTADDALAIAERNGGESTRAAVDNDCQVNILLAPGSSYRGWHVGYSSAKGYPLLDFDIDSATGSFEIVK